MASAVYRRSSTPSVFRRVKPAIWKPRIALELQTWDSRVVCSSFFRHFGWSPLALARCREYGILPLFWLPLKCRIPTLNNTHGSYQILYCMCTCSATSPAYFASGQEASS